VYRAEETFGDDERRIASKIRDMVVVRGAMAHVVEGMQVVSR
jgi:hypothetical protein